MFLNIFVEVILLSILVGGSYYGYKIGFFKLAAKPLKLVFSIVLSLLFCKTVGNHMIAPIIISRIDEGIREMTGSAVGAISTALAFIALLLLIRVTLSLIISLAARFLDGGIIGKINRGLGMLLAATVALISAYVLVLLIQCLLSLEAFKDSSLTKNFSGGLIYSLFVRLSRGGFLPSL